MARHAWQPGKEQAVDLCLEDFDDIMLGSRITDVQRGRLREIILGALSHAA